MQISGIEAAWREKEGTASLWIDGKEILFQQGKYTVKWSCHTSKEAEKMINIFRAATKYQASRFAVKG